MSVSINLPVKIIFEQVGQTLRVKPFPSYPTFQDIFTAADVSGDLSDINDAITALEAQDVVLEDSIDAAQADADAALAAVSAITPKDRRATMWHGEANASPTLTISLNTACIDNHVYFSTAQGFNAYHSFVCDTMPACKLFFIGTTANNQGILQVYLDGNAVTPTLDFYTAATVNNVVKSLSFAAGVITAGRHVLRLEVVNKNGSSAGYALVLTKYWLAPDVE